MNSLLLIMCWALSATVVASAKPIIVYFWATDVGPPIGTVTDGHPCGSVVLVETAVIPKDADWLEYETVEELDLKGEVLRSWDVPVDYYPVGTTDDWLLMNFGSHPESTLMVSPDGALKLAPQVIEPELKHLYCPANSAYEICITHPNLPDRYLAFRPPCT